VKVEIEAALKGVFPETNRLSSAISYALLSGGKRIRPLLVHCVAEAIGKGFPVMDAALAVEFFHTASLIADDLPCMDNDCLRRGKKAVHEEYGETVALLASYALISEAFKKIEENGKKMAAIGSKDSANEAVSIALEHASKFSGIKGAVLGQYYDLFAAKEENLTEGLIEKIIYLKTGTLFEGAFVLGWVFGGGDLCYLELVKKFARHFGFAFQVKDDLGDISQDIDKKSLNYALYMGRDLAKKRFCHEIQQCTTLLEGLPIKKLKLQLLLEELSQEN
jgi:geranylgeranyl diphosphate synthase type II